MSTPLRTLTSNEFKLAILTVAIAELKSNNKYSNPAVLWARRTAHGIYPGHVVPDYIIDRAIECIQLPLDAEVIKMVELAVQLRDWIYQHEYVHLLMENYRLYEVSTSDLNVLYNIMIVVLGTSDDIKWYIIQCFYIINTLKRRDNSVCGNTMITMRAYLGAFLLSPINKFITRGRHNTECEYNYVDATHRSYQRLSSIDRMPVGKELLIDDRWIHPLMSPLLNYGKSVSSDVHNQIVKLYYNNIILTEHYIAGKLPVTVSCADVYDAVIYVPTSEAELKQQLALPLFKR